MVRECMDVEVGREVSRVGEEQGRKDETVEYMVFRASGANCVQSECGRGNVVKS